MTVSDESLSKFTRYVLSGPFERASVPVSSLDGDGDRVEIVLTFESYRVERIDSFLTIHVGRESGDVVGYAIEGVSRLREIPPTPARTT